MGIVAALTFAYALNGMLIAIYLTSALIVAALWWTLWWLANREGARAAPAAPVAAAEALS